MVKILTEGNNMLTEREYLKRTNDNLKTCELHNVIYEY